MIVINGGRVLIVVSPPSLLNIDQFKIMSQALKIVSLF